MAYDRPPPASGLAQSAAIAVPGPDRSARNPGSAARPEHQAAAKTGRLALATIVVFGVWLGMSGSLMLYVATYTRNLPYNDDWELVPELTGATPITLEWLFARHNEHRFFLPRAFLLTAIYGTGLNFRAGPFLDAGILSAAALGMILTARRLRGCSRVSDAMFPLLCTNLGHYENLCYNFPTSFILVTGLACLLLMIIVRRANGFWGGLGAAACMILMPLAGVQGLLLSFPAPVWLFLIGIKRRGKFGYALAAGTVLVAAGVAFFCRPEIQPNSHASLSLSFSQSFTTALKIIGMGSGPKVLPISDFTEWALIAAVVGGVLLAFEKARGRGDTRLLEAFALVALCAAIGSLFFAVPGVQRFLQTLPIPSGIVASNSYVWPAPYWGDLALAIWVLSAGVLLRGSWQRKEWSRPIALCCFVACLLLLGLAIGYGRAGGASSTEGHNRYRSLMIPVLCWAYFVWEIDGGRLVKRLLPPVALVAAAAIAITYIPEAIAYGETFAYGQDRFRDALQSGQSADQLASSNAKNFNFLNRDKAFADCILMLRDAGHPAFQRVPPRPAGDANSSK